MGFGGEHVTDLLDRIERKLREGLEATHVEVEDESHLHVGHAGAAGGGGHFKATIVSDRFSGLSRVQAQRLVYGVLEQEMRGEIHALSMTTKTIDEAEDEA
jgi:BolA protein